MNQTSIHSTPSNTLSKPPSRYATKSDTKNKIPIFGPGDPIAGGETELILDIVPSDLAGVAFEDLRNEVPSNPSLHTHRLPYSRPRPYPTLPYMCRRATYPFASQISLTFRHIGTFLAPSEGWTKWKIRGQGAKAKMKEEAHKVVCVGPEGLALIQAFGIENRQSAFVWEEVYGEGSDVLHFENEGRSEIECSIYPFCSYQ